jgi:hypothetical protein
MVRSQARDPWQHARKQREAASCNQQPNRCNEKTADDASDARPAAESTEDALQCSGATVRHGCQGQEWECEADAVER